MDKSDETKAKESTEKSGNESATFEEYPPTKSTGIKTVEKQSENNKQNLESSTGYGAGGEYTSSTTQKENKETKESVTFAEYPPTQSVGIKSTIKVEENNKTNLESSTGYGADGAYTSTTVQGGKQEQKESVTFSEYPPTQSVGIKSSTKPPENKTNLESSTGYGASGEYKSTAVKEEKQEQKESVTFSEYPPTQSVGIKSSNKPPENKANLESSTGYGADGAYTSSTIQKENKSTQESITFAEYPPTQSVGIKSSVKPPENNNQNLESSTGYGASGEYTSQKIENKPSKEGESVSFAEYPPTQSVGIKSTVNNSNNQVTFTMTTTTTTTTVKSTVTGVNQPVAININPQEVPGQPLPGSTFAEYPQTPNPNEKK